MSIGFESGKRMYRDIGVYVDTALERLQRIPVSIHRWQLDDLSGFESPERQLSGGIAAIGDAPGKPRSKNEEICYESRNACL